LSTPTKLPLAPTSLASVKESRTVSIIGQPITAIMITRSGSMSSHARVVIQVPDIASSSSCLEGQCAGGRSRP
jgi:hypothetical protein